MSKAGIDEVDRLSGTAFHALPLSGSFEPDVQWVLERGSSKLRRYQKPGKTYLSFASFRDDVELT